MPCSWPAAPRPTAAQCEALIEIAVETCERYFQAFQFVIWAGKTPKEALAAACSRRVGEA